MLLLVYHKHTQWPGPGRTEQNVVGFPMLPVYAAKAGGFFFMVFGVIALMGGLLSINPVWKFGPYDPSKVTAGSQPDWYMGWPDGAAADHARLGDRTLGLHDLLERAILPILVLPGADVHDPDDAAVHRGLDHRRQARRTTCSSVRATPRRAPRVMVALMTFYGLLWAAGGNDIIAIKLHLSINQITYFMRVAVFVGPLIAFFITRRWCISLQRHDNEKLLHGYETGIIMRSPEGGYSERHLPISPRRAPTPSPRATATRSTTVGRRHRRQRRRRTGHPRSAEAAGQAVAC